MAHSHRSALASRLGATGPNASLLKHRRDELIDRADFRWKTFNRENNLQHQDVYRSPEQTNAPDTQPNVVNTLECWDYEHADGVERDQYVRFLEAGDARHFGTNDNEDPPEFGKRFRKWLERKGDYASVRPNGTGNLRGGLRLVLCERPRSHPPGMSMRRRMFECLEKEFGLHDATLPAFTKRRGCFSLFLRRGVDGQLQTLQIVVKCAHNLEVTNCLISLTYDVSTCWTDAFACADGLILGRKLDESYGNQQVQLLDACACVGKHMWTNPLLLPVALLQMCTSRAIATSKIIEKRLRGVEEALGVMEAGLVVIKEDRPQWPMDIDVKLQTREAHSTLPQILWLKGANQWQKRYASWLLETVDSLQGERALAGQAGNFQELRGTVQLLASGVDGMLESLECMEGRTQSQINLLFSVVGQRDAINSQKANDLNFEVARSTKEDSISMTTFTFITALFLPPSFIATMFSMGFFEWTAGSSSSDTQVVSDRYWICWAVALPLTLLTLGGWYTWYSHANRAWQRKLDRGSTAAQVRIPGTRAPEGAHIPSESENDEAAGLDENQARKEDEARRARKSDVIESITSLGPFRWMTSRRLISREKTDAV